MDLNLNLALGPTDPPGSDELIQAMGSEISDSIAIHEAGSVGCCGLCGASASAAGLYCTILLYYNSYTTGNTILLTVISYTTGSTLTYNL